MTQTAYAIADETTTGWETQAGGTTNLYQVIDEVIPSGTDYINNATFGNAARFTLGSLTDPASSSGHVISWRAAWLDGSGDITWTLKLKEGTSTRVTRTLTAEIAVIGFADATYTLTSGEADSITNYANLKLEFQVTASLGDEQVGIAWAVFEVPDPAGGQPCFLRPGTKERMLPLTPIKCFGR